MARKIVRVYISPEQKRLLERVCQTLGMHESEVLRYTFLEYANHLGLLSERVLGRI
jgi:hypothetical protein